MLSKHSSYPQGNLKEGINITGRHLSPDFVIITGIPIAGILDSWQFLVIFNGKYQGPKRFCDIKK